jgi:hypothetical protein
MWQLDQISRLCDTSLVVPFKSLKTKKTQMRYDELWTTFEFFLQNSGD